MAKTTGQTGARWIARERGLMEPQAISPCSNRLKFPADRTELTNGVVRRRKRYSEDPFVNAINQEVLRSYHSASKWRWRED